MPDLPEKNDATNTAIKNTFFNDLIIDYGSSTLSGIMCACILHIPTKMAYSAMIHNRPFFHADNRKNLSHGFTQTVGQRAFCGSVYFFIQKQMRTHFHPTLDIQLENSQHYKNFITGFTAGTVYALVNHPAAYIKAYTWSDRNLTFPLSIRAIYKMKGLPGFARALEASILRDAVAHGCTYEVLRHLLRTKAIDIQQNYALNFNKQLVELSSDFTAAFMGTVVSAPFNYARSIKFSTRLDLTPPSIIQIFRDVWQESKKQNASKLSQINYLKMRFGLSAGTIQAAFSFAFGQFAFNKINKAAKKKLLTQTEEESTAHLKSNKI